MPLIVTAETIGDLNLLLAPLVEHQTIVTVADDTGWQGQGIIVAANVNGVEFVHITPNTVTDDVSWELITELLRTHPELHTSRSIAWDRLTALHIW